jgi:hypothetical protein
MEKKRIVHQIYKRIPPDRDELIAEVDDNGLAEFKIVQLEAHLTREEKQNAVFHYHWIRLDEI